MFGRKMGLATAVLLLLPAFYVAGDSIGVGHFISPFLGRPPFQDPFVMGGDRIPEFTGKEIVSRLADGLPGFHVEPGFPLLVCDEVFPLGVLEHDGRGRVVDHGAELLLGVAERFLRALAFRDVGDDRADGDSPRHGREPGDGSP